VRHRADGDGAVNRIRQERASVDRFRLQELVPGGPLAFDERFGSSDAAVHIVASLVEVRNPGGTVTD
jgi:hypothetical protein